MNLMDPIRLHIIYPLVEGARKEFTAYIVPLVSAARHDRSRRSNIRVN